MTELTEDQFYDNGNIAINIAALLGISPTRIKIVNVIRETSSQRRKRRAASGLYYLEYNTRVERDTDDESSSLQFEVGNGNQDDPDEIADSGDEEVEKAKAEELNKIGANMASLAADPSNPVGGATVDAIKDDDPSATVGEMAVGYAEPPKTSEDLPQWFDPENPVGESIIQQAGLSEEEIGADGEVDFEKLKQQLLAQTGVDLDELQTAAEKAEEEQERRDKAAEPIVYKTPTTMIIVSQPTRFQVEDTVFSESFVLRMLDQDGEEMEVVGFAGDPARVTIALNSSESGEISGTLEVPFTAGDGRAIFDNISVNNTDDSVAFTFSVAFPSFNLSVIPADVTSNAVEIMEKMTEPEGPCEEVEGSTFDKKEMWDATCSRLCTLPCMDFGDLVSPAPQCIQRDTTSCGQFATCSNSTGCECDMESIPRTHLINVEDHIGHTCGPEGMIVTINKCVMHKFGFRLEDLAIDGVDRNYEGPLRSSGVNTCLGSLDYSQGSDYVFKLIGGNDCGTVKTYNDSHVTYENAIR